MFFIGTISLIYSRKKKGYILNEFLGLYSVFFQSDIDFGLYFGFDLEELYKNDNVSYNEWVTLLKSEEPRIIFRTNFE